MAFKAGALHQTHLQMQSNFNDWQYASFFNTEKEKKHKKILKISVGHKTLFVGSFLNNEKGFRQFMANLIVDIPANALMTSFC